MREGKKTELKNRIRKICQRRVLETSEEVSSLTFDML